MSSADLGRRATLRIKLPDGRFRDIVGVLEWWDAGVIGVRRRDGSAARVDEADVVASRIVPQQPPPRRRAAPGS
ncbi:hypothetical protein [Nocardiopsis ansamitocini]|uniref:putative acetyltransferase n=1 Tax=Nocardiopsis ansamitocini TaxID=1670832 RepID=UPI0025533244|nr:hypothetical protein [Nocardiopsis ansamitocini]